MIAIIILANAHYLVAVSVWRLKFVHLKLLADIRDLLLLLIIFSLFVLNADGEGIFGAWHYVIFALLLDIISVS